jgi:hypothetical protein
MGNAATTRTSVHTHEILTKPAEKRSVAVTTLADRVQIQTHSHSPSFPCGQNATAHCKMHENTIKTAKNGDHRVQAYIPPLKTRKVGRPAGGTCGDELLGIPLRIQAFSMTSLKNNFLKRGYFTSAVIWMFLQRFVPRFSVSLSVNTSRTMIWRSKM